MKLYKYDGNALDYKRLRWRTVLPIILAVQFLIIGSSFFAGKNTETKYITTETEVNLITNNSFSKEALIKEIQRLPFKYKDIILSQAILESGNFKSPVFLESHNLFGLREAKQRLTLSKGTHLNHAYYSNWRESVLDRLLYETKYLGNLSRADYLKYLDASYAQAGNYDKVLESIIKKNRLKEKFKNE